MKQLKKSIFISLAILGVAMTSIMVGANPKYYKKATNASASPCFLTWNKDNRPNLKTYTSIASHVELSYGKDIQVADIGHCTLTNSKESYIKTSERPFDGNIGGFTHNLESIYINFDSEAGSLDFHVGQNSFNIDKSGTYALTSYGLMGDTFKITTNAIKPVFIYSFTITCRPDNDLTPSKFNAKEISNHIQLMTGYENVNLPEPDENVKEIIYHGDQITMLLDGYQNDAVDKYINKMANNGFSKIDNENLRHDLTGLMINVSPSSQDGGIKIILSEDFKIIDHATLKQIIDKNFTNDNIPLPSNVNEYLYTRVLRQDIYYFGFTGDALAYQNQLITANFKQYGAPQGAEIAYIKDDLFIKLKMSETEALVSLFKLNHGLDVNKIIKDQSDFYKINIHADTNIDINYHYIYQYGESYSYGSYYLFNITKEEFINLGLKFKNQGYQVKPGYSDIEQTISLDDKYEMYLIYYGDVVEISIQESQN